MAGETDGQVIRLDESDVAQLRRTHPHLKPDATWAVSGDSDTPAIQAILEILAAVYQRPGNTPGIDVRVGLGDRTVTFELKTSRADGSSSVNGPEPIEAVIRELPLAARLSVDPNRLARSRRRLDEAWDALVNKYGAATDYEFAMGRKLDVPRPETYISSLVRKRELLTVRRNNVRYLPRFQFDAKWNTRPALVPTLRALPPRWTNFDRALWFAAPNGWLDGQRPADTLTYPNAVGALAEAAHRASATAA